MKRIIYFVVIIFAMPLFSTAQTKTSAAERMNELGPENAVWAQRTGTWDVTETIWDSAGATPHANRYMAERKMIGQFLQETIRPIPGSGVADFTRIYYLSFNRVEGRWKYVSLVTSNPVGLMPAASFDVGEKNRITLMFDPFSIPGNGKEVSGQMLRMKEILTIQDADHDTAEEYFIVTNGTGKQWLSYKYDYVRRK